MRVAVRTAAAWWARRLAVLAWRVRSLEGWRRWRRVRDQQRDWIRRRRVRRRRRVVGLDIVGLDCWTPGF